MPTTELEQAMQKDLRRFYAGLREDASFLGPFTDAVIESDLSDKLADWLQRLHVRQTGNAPHPHTGMWIPKHFIVALLSEDRANWMPVTKGSTIIGGKDKAAVERMMIEIVIDQVEALLPPVPVLDLPVPHRDFVLRNVDIERERWEQLGRRMAENIERQILREVLN